MPRAQCRFIFRAAGLDLGRLATAFALLRLPRMPELPGAGQQLPHFSPSPVDPGTVKACALYRPFPRCWQYGRDRRQPVSADHIDFLPRCRPHGRHSCTVLCMCCGYQATSTRDDIVVFKVEAILLVNRLGLVNRGG